MLTARRKADGQLVEAYFESKSNGPFFCPTCNDEVILRSGKNRVAHFVHAYPLACHFAEGESDEHRACKQQIFDRLRMSTLVSKLALERSLDEVRPDISGYIHGARVAIEVQLSSLSVEKIKERTAVYTRKGIHVLWLLQWRPELDKPKYCPEPWEKWLHTLYFGHVYYWTSGLNVLSYHFEPSFISIRQNSWYSGGMKRTAGGYSKRSKRYRTPLKEGSLHLINDFQPKERSWFETNGRIVPSAKLYLPRYQRSNDGESFAE